MAPHSKSFDTNYFRKRLEEEKDANMSAFEKNKLLEKKRKATMKKLTNDSDDEEEEDDIKTEFQIDDETAIKLLEENEIKQPLHLNELRLSTMENDVFVDAEPDSVNFVNFHFNEETLDSVGFVCQNFYDKGGKFLARNLTRMPDLDMIGLMYCMIFSPMVELIPNSTKEYFEKIKLENSDANIFLLPYQLTHNDIQNIQVLRQKINHTLCSEDAMKQTYIPNVSRDLLQIIYKERMGIKILNKITKMGSDKDEYSHLADRIKGIFKNEKFSDEEAEGEENEKDEELEDENEDDSVNHQSSVKMESEYQEEKDEDEQLDQDIMKEAVTQALGGFDEPEEGGEGEDDNEYYEDPDEEMEDGSTKQEVEKEEPADIKDEELLEEEKVDNPLIKPIVKKEGKKVCYFLNDIIYTKLQSSILFDSGEKDKIENEFNKRYSFRKHIQRELERRIDVYGLKEWAIVWERWESILCYLHNLDMKKESSGLWEIKGLLLGLTEIRLENKFKSNDKYIIETMRKLQGESDFDFLSCQFKHVLGIRVKFKYFFTKDSPILFKFPMGSTREWCLEMWKNQFAEALEQENITKKNIDWSNLSPEDKFCTICNAQFATADQLVDHWERDRSHKETTARFLLQETESELEKLH